MRTSAVVLSFVLLQAGSNAFPISPSKASPLADPSLSLPESCLKELADKKYKNQKTDEYSITPLSKWEKKGFLLDILVNH